jgi:hypothetical protein
VAARAKQVLTTKTSRIALLRILPIQTVRRAFR